MLKLYGVGRGRPKQGVSSQENAGGATEAPKNTGTPVSGDTGSSLSSGVNAASAASSNPAQERRRFPGEIRLQKELEDLDLPDQCVLTFSSKNGSLGKRSSDALALQSGGGSSLLDMQLRIAPDDGFWRGGKFLFFISIPPNYPHDPPKVKCMDQIYHPNIDQKGNVCLNILREDWKPVLSISSVMYGLLHLFLEPNPSDPLNQEAAALLRSNPSEFQRQVRRTLHQ
ncbi:Ubiquitin carrier protein, related [Neospora caninum Liverpool]|uniref:Ubiquitin carrier protein, related n=1 Tax=Neospora caninum (strain Liverpool) TaxID=572307 RepID=F0VEL0_NEOCL|nr:Ubiquitin carrier protein, related [Neospora caninum Liverpool]CBZ52154.1 Ubiquitin carrier protein, related [Neospora caninum Liverpool]CEL66118.1 TPA: Ubiquitin carrier protein, related [Neospora caninum Liverpool]|eukprot:XP_003882186.1 Ubiquitin carrier protein, related [Neospora caninum Liverpool]